MAQPFDEESHADLRPAVRADTRYRRAVRDDLDFVWRMLHRFGVPSDDVSDAAQQGS